MSDKNLNNQHLSPFDDPDLFGDSKSLIMDQLEKISNGLSHCASLPNPTLSEVPHLSDLSQSLLMPELQLAVIALVALSNPNCDTVT